MKLALLCDYGLDDMVATLYLLKHADKFEQIDILPVGGNFPLADAFNNAKRILTYVERLPSNVNLVDTSSVAQFEEKLAEIHGADGIGNFLPKEHKYDGKVLDYDVWLGTVDESYVIMSLGPCTVTADILKNKSVNSLILMCGNIAEPPNHGEYEFNHGMDPAAFSECVEKPHFVATLDTCHCEQCDFNRIKIENDGLFERAIKKAVELSNSRGEKSCYIYDLVAAKYLLHPELFTSYSATDPFGNRLNVLKYISTEQII